MATIKQILAMSAAERDALNQSILATLTNVPCAAAEFHASQLKNWSVKLCGPKPSPEMVAFNYILDGGRRAGDEPLWPAMTLRANGATVAEYMRASSAGGAAHNNAAKYNTERGGTGWLVRIPLPNDTRAGRWQHVITDKGAAQLAKRVAALTGTAEAKPAKAERPAAVVAGKAKVRAAKKAVSEAKVELTAAVNAASLEVPVTEVTPAAEVVTPEQLQALANQFNS